MVTIQKYVKAQSLEEAWKLNQGKKNRILGGMLWMRLGNGTISTAIDLCDLGLDTIEETDEEFSIGARVTLRELEQHVGLNTYTHDAVKNAVKDIVGVQFRNMATIGGSIWGRFGFSDVLTVFLAMDSYVELYKGGIVPLSEFAWSKRDNDILVGLIVKKRPVQIVYQSLRLSRTDFPVLASAVVCLDGKWRAVIGARPQRALLIEDEENLLGGGLTEENIRKFAAYVKEKTPTGSNMRAGADYRSHLVEVQVRRALERMRGEENAD